VPEPAEPHESLNRGMITELRDSAAITTDAVASAFAQVHRHRFVPESAATEAYRASEAIPTRQGVDGMSTSSSSAPSIMAPMLEQLGVAPGSRVLEIGTGTGYNAALLDVLVGEDGSVSSVDIQPDVVEEARGNLQRTGHGRLHLRIGDGWEGWAAAAPFDAIELTVGAEDISPHWVEQLRENGTLVLPLWLRAGIQLSIAFRKEGSGLRSGSIVPCGFMRLQGAHAGRSSAVKVGSSVALFDHPELGEAVSELLASSPRAEPIEEPPSGWFDRVALQEEETLPLTLFEEGTWIDRRGVFDAAGESLAVVSEKEILSYGSGRASERLRELLTTAEPFDLTELSIEALPTEQAGTFAAGGWMIERPSFTFFLLGRSAPR
jgi:protein-L-isoaspartate(D-aspartate) O-methyltransferase